MLESYIAPLFMGYVDKYIKNLKPSDLSLSLWGGDAVLQNLELNLDVLQQELNLPVKFLSGKIYKLQIHVPWTRLTYDPVVITIDTVEFVVKLKDASDGVGKAEDNKPSKDLENEIQSAKSHETEQLPPGYVQSILNKVINNVAFKINNVIIKYVEDDIVFSLNVKSVDFHSSDENWEEAFIDLTLPELILRKVCDITDLTICLDQQSSSGRIELYQDPVLYKCNLSCRILSRYKGLSSSKPYNNTVNIYCESADFSLTDLQIPMVIRLLKLAIGLFYGTLDLPGCDIKQHTAPDIIENHKKEKTRLSTTLVDDSTQADTSWSSWAWSMVPGYGDAENKSDINKKEDTRTNFGIYVTQTTVTFKTTSRPAEYVISTQRLEFSPVFCLEFSGCVMEFVSIGDTLIDVNMGVQHLLGYTIGKQCVCAVTEVNLSNEDSTDEDMQLEDTVFVKVGLKNNDKQPLHYLSQSLFATYVNEITNESVDPIKNMEKPLGTSEEIELPDLENQAVPVTSILESIDIPKSYKPGGVLSTDEVINRYGAIFMNYYYEMSYPEILSGEIENIFLYPETDEIVPETSEKRIHLAAARLFVTTKFVHALQWLHKAVNVTIPNRKEKSGVFLDPFVLQQLSLGNLLSRKLTVTCSDSEMYILTNDHEKQKCTRSSYLEEKEALVMQLGKFTMTKVDPMYPTELISMVEKGKLVKLNKMNNLNSSINLQVVDFQLGLSLVNQETLSAFTLFVIQPTSASLYVTISLFPETLKNSQSSPVINANYELQCELLSLSFTKVHVMLLYEIINSWLSTSMIKTFPALVNTTFHPSGSKSKAAPLMDIHVKGLNCRFLDMNNIQGISGSLESVKATLQSIGNDGNVKTSLLYNAPSKTTHLSDINNWLSKSPENVKCSFVKFAVQYQKGKTETSDVPVQVASINIAGSTTNLDELFFSWLNHEVDYQARRRIQSVRRQGSTLNQSASLTTPRKSKSYARVFGSNTSPSHHSKDKEKLEKDEATLNEKEGEKQERFGEWLARKISFFKSFNLQVNVEPFVLIFPEKQWPEGYNIKDHIDMLRLVYLFQNDIFPPSLILCLPKISVKSSNQNERLLEQDIPILSTQKRRKIETLPWTITSENLSLYTLFPNMDQLSVDGKVEWTYLCKPVSWNLFLASANPSRLLSRTASNLGIITEKHGNKHQSEQTNVIRIPLVQDKQRGGEYKLINIGYVLHMDWSICEFSLSHKQLKLLSTIAYKLYNLSKALTFKSNEADPSTTFPVKPLNNTAGDALKQIDTHSVSSASTVDQVDAFSTLTGSTSMFAKPKTTRPHINISLWIQCTMPKVKCAIISEEKRSGYLYQVISEIEEIMFAFDYQDNVLELTNKIGSCVVYYSLLRFDTEPKGWIAINNGYLLCQKEKFHESSHLESKTLFSVLYKRTHQLSQSITSPEQTVSELQRKSSEKDTAISLPSTTIQVHDDYIVKHELTIYMLSFDVIGDSKPILSSVGLFTDMLSTNESKYDSTTVLPSKPVAKDVTSNVVTLPLITIHCDRVRVIIPVGENGKAILPGDNNSAESVFVCHFQSIDLTPSPTNPITKTVTDKALYRLAKNNFRDSLKKLKLWNVQYQLDIVNIGLCTTNWQSLENSLPSRREQVQNPALEWNSQSWHNQQSVSPIFPGFDYKATLAPPIMIMNSNQAYPVTAAAFEFHSPREVKSCVNSNQIALALQVMHDVNTLVSDVGTLFKASQQDFSVTDPFHDNEDSGVAVGKTPKKSSATKFVMPAVEMFASVSSISLTLYYKEFSATLKPTIYPAVLVNLMQPTCTITSFKENSLQLSIYDISILTTSSICGISGNVVPVVSDFDTNILTCGKGNINKKTGLIPGLLRSSLSLKDVSNLFVGVGLERSLHVKMHAKSVKNIQSFITHLLNTIKKESLLELNEDDTNSRHQSEMEVKGQQKEMLRLQSVKLSMQQLFLSASPSCGDEILFANIQYQRLEINSCFQYSKRCNQLESINVESSFWAFQIFCSQSTNRTNIVLPFNFELNVLGELCQHAGNLTVNSFYPRTYVWYHSGLTKLNLCQNTLAVMETLKNEITDLITLEDKSDMLREPKNIDHVVLDSTLITSEDDLRNGQFDYVVQDSSVGGVDFPEEYQIVFTNESDSSPMMTWKYPEPRMIKNIHIFPVPFCVSNSTRERWVEDTETIPCILEYWDEISHAFIPCERMFLSENESAQVLITEDLSKGVLSHTWRVVVVIPEEVKCHNAANNIKKTANNISPVPATSLAACMKVNSCHSPALVPSLELCCVVEEFNVIIGNSVESLGTKSPSKLSPYYMEADEAFPDMTEAVNLVLSNVKCDVNFLNNMNIAVDVSSKIEADVMDYNNYCWINLLKPAEFSVSINRPLTNYEESPVTLDVNVEEMDFVVTQTGVHTLSLTTNAWLSMFNKETEVPLFSHYVLCNETHDTIHIKQINTDEDIALHSGQLYPYSWCSLKLPMLHFCLASVGDWRWSEPIDINQLGIFPQKIDHSGYSSQLFVEVKRIGGLQKQIIFHGSCSIVNNLNFDVSLEVVTQETDHSPAVIQQNVHNVSERFTLFAGVSRPSLTVSTSFMKSIKVVMCELDGSDCGTGIEMPFLQNNEESHRCIQLKDGKRTLKCWLSFYYSSRILGHLVVTLSPLFIFRNHLAEPALIKVEDSQDNKEVLDTLVNGKGKEIQIFKLDEHKLYNVSFCLIGSREKSKPPFQLSTNQAKLLKQESISSLLGEDLWPYIDAGNEVATICTTSQKVSYKTHGPKHDLNIDDLTKKSWQEAELILQSCLKWSHLPTILVDLKPRILICNKTSDDLQIRSLETGYVDVVEGGTTASTLHVQKRFLLGMQLDGVTYWSQAVTLDTGSLEPESPSLNENLKPGTTTHCSILIKKRKLCYQFSFTCEENEAIVTVCIRNRFMVHNLSSSSLIIVPLMVEDMISAVTLDHVSALKLDPITTQPTSLLNLEKPDITNASPCLAMNFKLNTSSDGLNQTAGENTVTISNHTARRSESLNLSEEHLRESFNLVDVDKHSSSFALTSCFEKGVVHVFISGDTTPIIKINNYTSLTLALKEIEPKNVKLKKRFDILVPSSDVSLTMQPNSQTSCNPRCFTNIFPKTENELKLNCQLGLVTESTVELSKPVLLEKQANVKLFIPGHGEVCIKTSLRNSQLIVGISEGDAPVPVLVTKPLTLPVLEFSFNSLNIVVVDYQYTDDIECLLSLSFGGMKVIHNKNRQCSMFKVTLGYFQIDNQLQDSCYHFPVIFLPMRRLSERYHTVTKDAPFPEVEACLDAAFGTLTFEVSDSDGGSDICIDNMRVNIQPCEMYLEDTFVYRLAAVIDSYIPPSKSSVARLDDVTKVALHVLHPMRACNVEVGELSLLLSVHASVKVFLAADHIPLVLGRYKCQSTQTVQKEFVRSMLYHYATQALVRAGWILGSLEIIGNPTGLIHNIGRGVSDFFVLPYNGLIRGPTAFVSGIGHGMSSFLKHISTGALTSINNVSSSISRNMDRLCFDEMHLQMQEERRAVTSTRVLAGFQNAFGTLGINLLGAVAGIADHPIQNFLEANNASEAISGVMTGMAKGMIGMVTKPIGGAMEFISQASQGILQGAGLVKTPERVFLMQLDSAENLGRKESQMKFLWQYLHLDSCRNIFIVSNCTIQSNKNVKTHAVRENRNDGSEEDKHSIYQGVLILTETALFVYSVNVGEITSAFPLKEVELVPSHSDDSYTLQIYKRAIEEKCGYHRSVSLDENPNFRQFFESFQKASATSLTETMCENLSNAILEVKIKPLYGKLLLTLYEANKTLLQEEDFMLDTIDL